MNYLMSDSTLKTNLVVIGGGPGGYTSAFRAADLGQNVILIDKNSNLGGVCLNRGCIPSKSLLHLSKIINDAKKAKIMGVTFETPDINVKNIHKWKNKIINDLNIGIEKLAKARNVKIINGHASFKSANQLTVVDHQDKAIEVQFDNCIIATGSKPQVLSHLNKSHPSILDSTSALNFQKIPKKLLVIGGGYIGLELGSVFDSLGSKVTVAEFLPTLLSMADEDLVKYLFAKLREK